MKLEVSLRKGPDVLSVEEVVEDIDTLIFALRHAYVGIDMIKKETETVIQQLENLRDEATAMSPQELAKLLGGIMRGLPDAHIGVSYNTINYANDFREGEWAVGKNIGLDVGNGVWHKSLVSVAGTSLPAFSILKFPDPSHTAWEGFLDAVSEVLDSESLIIDLRGCGGGHSTMAKKLAALLINETVEHPHRETVEKNTSEAWMLLLNRVKRDKALAEKHSGDVSYFETLLNRRTAGMKRTLRDTPSPLIRHTYETPDVSQCNFKGSLYVLADRRTGSSGEHAVRLLRFHPYTLVVGEHTAGAIHFGNAGLFNLPHSTIAITLSTKYFVPFENEYYEKIGYPPDVEVPAGEDALMYIPVSEKGRNL